VETIKTVDCMTAGQSPWVQVWAAA